MEPNLYGVRLIWSMCKANMMNSHWKPHYENSSINVQQAVDRLVTEVYENLAPKLEQRHIINQMLRLLTNDSPVKFAEVAMHLQAPPGQNNIYS